MHNYKDKTFVAQAGWYRFSSSAAIKKNKLTTFNFFGTSLIAFRSKDNEVRIFEAFCPHLGAHLGGGKLKADNVICPFHGWQYNSLGQCIKIPYCDKIPTRAKLNSFPAFEVTNSIYIFYGDESSPRTTYSLTHFHTTYALKPISTRKISQTILQTYLADKVWSALCDTSPGYYLLSPTNSKQYLLTALPINQHIIQISLFSLTRNDKPRLHRYIQNFKTIWMMPQPVKDILT